MVIQPTLEMSALLRSGTSANYSDDGSRANDKVFGLEVRTVGGFQKVLRTGQASIEGELPLAGLALLNFEIPIAVG